MSEIKPLARKADIVVQNLEDETLVFDLITNKALALNATSSMVWELCDGTKNISEITTQLSVKLNDLVTEDLIWLSLEQLKKENLIENESVESSRFDGLSRREVIRKIGFASMVTLPLIVSLVAPVAINAGSCAAAGNGAMLNFIGCPCNGVADCANPNPCCGTTSAPFSCVSPNTVAACQPCRANCECDQPGGYSCPPAVTGRPRICRPMALPPPPPLPEADNCV